MKDEILKYNLNSEKIFLVRNPISIQNTRRGIIPIRTEVDKIKLIFVGRLVYQKGIDRILHLFKTNHNIELIVVGKGSFKNELLKKVKNLNIEDKIKELAQYSNRKEEISVDLAEQKITYGNNEIKFDIDDFKKECLIEGYDDIALSLNHKSKIESFENKIRTQRPWIFND